jgi:hypothetical protein
LGSTPVIQTSFNSGEWAPALNARVDVQKYHSGAALLRNFYVDYRGGATTRPGSKYILNTFTNFPTRLIPFQASFTVSYVLEFSRNYIRFFQNGAPILEAPQIISGVTNANPGVITSTAHGYSSNDWIFISGINGMTQLNGNYYNVLSTTVNTFTITDLFGNPVDTSGFGVYGGGGTASRVYTIASPYQDTEVKQIKFAQNVNVLILCHPNYPPYQLVLNSATNWTLTPIFFGATIGPPATPTVATTLAAGSVQYAYIVTSVDKDGQESASSPYATLTGVADIRTVAGTNTVSWTAVAGAVSYNVYKAEPSYAGGIPVGAQFGFCGNCTGTVFIDSNISQDFNQGPPVEENPFAGSGVQSVTLTDGGSYAGLAAPAVTFSGGGGIGAAALATVVCTSVAPTGGPWTSSVGDTYHFPSVDTGSLFVRVSAVDGSGFITTLVIVSQNGINFGGTIPPAVIPAQDPSFNVISVSTIWQVGNVALTSPGAGYATPPAVVFSTGAATATSTLGAPSSGNPTVPGFFQQRFVLAGPVSSPQQMNFSQPGLYYNFNVNNPIEGDDAIQATLVSGQLNTIQSLTPQPQGLIVLGDKQAWLINGGSPGAPISAIQIVANVQSYNGSSFPPPIIANDNILYVQAKGSIVRDLVFNFYTQVYTGTDISVLSSHLFYGFSLKEWAWSEEPFKLVWAVRNDGTMLTLTFLKEQELIAWAHSDTQGLYKSVATVTELTGAGNVDAVYAVVQRTINGRIFQYIERFAQQNYSGNLAGAWCVDAGISYAGASTLTFTGAQHLAGMNVVGIATSDAGVTSALVPFTMPVSGTFTLPAPVGGTGYTYVLVGLAFTPQLQTLAIDTGEPTIQGKRKKITAVTVRVKDALGLSIGGSASTLTPMKDLVVGNVGSASNTIVSNLVTTDARTIIEPNWTVPGQYFIQQSNPFPASILGVIPEITVGDK